MEDRAKSPERQDLAAPLYEDIELRISADAIIGAWVNDTPFTIAGDVVQQWNGFAFAANGKVTFHYERSGRFPMNGSDEGTWTLTGDTLTVHLPDRRMVNRFELTLIRRHGRSGIIRVALRSRSGGVWWRPEPTTPPAAAERLAAG